MTKAGSSAATAVGRGAVRQSKSTTATRRVDGAKANARTNPRSTFSALRRAYPDAHCELKHRDPFELLVSTVLSAQSTDVSVNAVTPELFRLWPNPKRLARADLADVEKVLARLGMFRQKARHIVQLSQALVRDHGGVVPRSLDELVRLSGVGRKTANVVLGVAFGAPEGVVVDTHVQRLSQRLGWTEHSDPAKIERDLMKLFVPTDWDALSHTLIFHGRRCCTARKPDCAACPVKTQCPSAFAGELVGRKPAAKRKTAARGSPGVARKARPR